MKKLKCIKCGLIFKDREDPIEEIKVHKKLCWNCRHIWQVLGMVISSFNYNPMMPKSLNREVVLSLDDVHIRRIKTQSGKRRSTKSASRKVLRTPHNSSVSSIVGE